MNTTEKKKLLAEIKSLKESHAALEVGHMRYNRIMRVLRDRLAEIEAEQQKIAVEIWRKENEAGIEQLLMF